MTELNGLKSIVGSMATLHGLEEPPYRQNFPDEAEYQRAFQDWFTRTNFWRISRTTDEPQCAVCLDQDLGSTTGPDGQDWPVVCGACTPTPGER